MMEYAGIIKHRANSAFDYSVSNDYIISTSSPDPPASVSSASPPLEEH
jgi:hypothetical protein